MLFINRDKIGILVLILRVFLGSLTLMKLIVE